MGIIRGKKIDNTLFALDEPVAEETAEERRGRDAELIASRNEHLLYRYMWYRMRHPIEGRPWALKKIAADFYLSESTVGQLIEATDINVLNKIKNDNLSDRQLRRRFPWW